MKKKQFPLGHVLSITTGRCVCQGVRYPIDGIYDILNHITGESLYTHALVRASKFAKPLLLAKYPDLALAGSDVSIARLEDLLADEEKPEKAIARWIGELGLPETYEVEQSANEWCSIDPMEELASMVGPEKVIPVVL